MRKCHFPDFDYKGRLSLSNFKNIKSILTHRLDWRHQVPFQSVCPATSWYSVQNVWMFEWARDVNNSQLPAQWRNCAWLGRIVGLSRVRPTNLLWSHDLDPSPNQQADSKHRPQYCPLKQNIIILNFTFVRTKRVKLTLSILRCCGWVRIAPKYFLWE